METAKSFCWKGGGDDPGCDCDGGCESSNCVCGCDCDCGCDCESESDCDGVLDTPPRDSSPLSLLSAKEDFPSLPLPPPLPSSSNAIVAVVVAVGVALAAIGTLPTSCHIITERGGC